MKKILSIDGGGIRGLIPALLLAETEKKTRKPISETFDLVAGTSTGGILALGLAKPNKKGKPKYSAKVLAKLYAEHGKEIFERSLWKGITSVGGITDEVYSQKGIESLLKKYFFKHTHECLPDAYRGDDVRHPEPRARVYQKLEKRAPFGTDETCGAGHLRRADLF
jgi:patatin-like phospholipase/acyl hydrolase